jgi:UDP-glucose 4-epimerase
VRALVTGGAGFIGSTLVDRLLAEGHAVDVVDDLSTGRLGNLADARSGGGELSFHRLDIRAAELVDLMVRRRPEVVFHLAAQADVRVSVARPVFDAEINVIGSLNVLEGARAAGAAKVVFASSGGTIYGDPQPDALPVKESHPQEPVSPYGVAKKVVTDYLRAYRDLHDLEFTSLALANVYGPRQDPHGEAGVVAIFADLLLRGEPVRIFGDGTQTRDFVFVDDVVDAFARAAERGGGLLLNIGTGIETSVNGLYQTMCEALGDLNDHPLAATGRVESCPIARLPDCPSQSATACLNSRIALRIFSSSSPERIIFSLISLTISGWLLSMNS